MSDLRLLSVEDVLVIRQRLTRSSMAGKQFGGPKPLKPNELESAVARQSTGIGNTLKYKTPVHVGAALFYGLALNHIFENGNKRTALVAMLVLLDRNKVTLTDATEDDLYEMALAVADHKIVEGARATADEEVEAIRDWLESRRRTVTLGDGKTDFPELKKRLEALGCTFDSPNQNFVTIRRETPEGELAIKTGYPRRKFDIAPNEVKRIRKGLQLDEIHGFDTGAFQGLEEQIDGFVNRYRQVLVRLADV